MPQRLTLGLNRTAPLRGAARLGPKRLGAPSKRGRRMSRVIWLDDEFDGVRRGAFALHDAGHKVLYSDSEDEVLQWLSDGPPPDILIQDLQRPAKSQIKCLTLLGKEGGRGGWRVAVRLFDLGRGALKA